MHISTVSSIHCCAVSVSIFFFTQCRHRNTRELIHSSILNWCIHSSNGNEEKKSFVIAYNCRLHISNKISRKKNKTKIKIFHTNELIPLNQVISNWNIVCLLGLMGILFFFLIIHDSDSCVDFFICTESVRFRGISCHVQTTDICLLYSQCEGRRIEPTRREISAEKQIVVIFTRITWFNTIKYSRKLWTL